MTAEEIKEEQDDQDVILIEKAELIAPMTRIRGRFKLTSTSITFIPDQEQESNVKNRDEINLAMNPPPLPMSPHLNSSQARGRSSSYGVVKLANLKSNPSGSSKNLLLPNIVYFHLHQYSYPHYLIPWNVTLICFDYDYQNQNYCHLLYHLIFQFLVSLNYHYSQLLMHELMVQLMVV